MTMTIDELITALTEQREQVGGDMPVKMAVGWRMPDIVRLEMQRYKDPRNDALAIVSAFNFDFMD